MESKYQLLNACELPDLSQISNQIADTVWPKFMLNDPVAEMYWHYLYQKWPEYQFAIMQADNIVATGNSVPLYWEHAFEELPDEGWDWILPKAIDDSNHQRKANIQVAIQIMVPKEYQGKGLSAHAVRGMKSIGLQQGHKHLIVPLRPNHKCKYPNTSMNEYLSWKNETGLPFDPWIRVHTQLGGQIIKVCTHSMRIQGSIDEWYNWTGIPFTTSGEHVVPGALCPVKVDIEKQMAVYIEPNVWLKHTIVNE